MIHATYVATLVSNLLRNSETDMSSLATTMHTITNEYLGYLRKLFYYKSQQWPRLLHVYARMHTCMK